MKQKNPRLAWIFLTQATRLLSPNLVPIERCNIQRNITTQQF